MFIYFHMHTWVFFGVCFCFVLFFFPTHFIFWICFVFDNKHLHNFALLGCCNYLWRCRQEYTLNDHKRKQKINFIVCSRFFYWFYNILSSQQKILNVKLLLFLAWWYLSFYLAMWCVYIYIYIDTSISLLRQWLCSWKVLIVHRASLFISYHRCFPREEQELIQL